MPHIAKDVRKERCGGGCEPVCDFQGPFGNSYQVREPSGVLFLCCENPRLERCQELPRCYVSPLWPFARRGNSAIVLSRPGPQSWCGFSVL